MTDDPDRQPARTGASRRARSRPPGETANAAGRRAAAEGRLVGAAGTGRPANPARGGGGDGPRRAAPDRRRRASAGRVIGVFLLCFGIWFVLDANQLYRNAAAQPLGARRTAAIIMLRPIAAVTNALGISGPVNAADSARSAAAGRSPGPSAAPAGAGSCHRR